jgi:hypothetical protein
MECSWVPRLPNGLELSCEAGVRGTAFKVTEQGRQSSPRFPWKTGKFASLGLEIRNLTQRHKDAEAQKGPEFRVRDFLRLCVCLAPLVRQASLTWLVNWKVLTM